MQAAYLARRKALLEQQRNNPQLSEFDSRVIPPLGEDVAQRPPSLHPGGFYASPYNAYGPPLSPYGRTMYYPRYGYGGGYGYGCGGYGYGGM